MSLPLEPKKWQFASFVNPDAFIDYASSKKLNTRIKCSRALFSWVKSYTEEAIKLHPVKAEFLLNHKVYNWPHLLVHPHMGIGAPAAGIILEEYIALGLKQVVGLGLAGALNPGLRPGDVVLCSEALRDEGTSYHYLPANEQVVFANGEWLKIIESILQKEGVAYHKGASWTTDAPYRETKEEIMKYSAQGTLTVEMEAAALYAIAKARGVQAVSLFIVSDVLDGEVWQPYFYNKILIENYQKLLNILIKNLGVEG